MYLIDSDGDRWNRVDAHPHMWEMESNGSRESLDYIKGQWGPVEFYGEDGGDPAQDPTATTFQSGQKVHNTTTGVDVEIVSGPHRYNGETAWLVARDNGDNALIWESCMELPAPVDPRIEVVAKWLFEDDGSSSHGWTSAGNATRSAYHESAVNLLSALDSMTS